MMTLVPPEQVVHVWPTIMQTLDKALMQAKGNPFTLFSELVSGQSSAWMLDGDAQGVMVASIDTNTAGEPVLWVEYAAGAIRGGPKRKRRAVDAIMDNVCLLARRNGCKEVRVEGRMEWSRLLTGFMLTEVDGTEVLRKAL